MSFFLKKSLLYMFGKPLNGTLFAERERERLEARILLQNIPKRHIATKEWWQDLLFFIIC